MKRNESKRLTKVDLVIVEGVVAANRIEESLFEEVLSELAALLTSPDHIRTKEIKDARTYKRIRM